MDHNNPARRQPQQQQQQQQQYAQGTATFAAGSMPQSYAGYDERIQPRAGLPQQTINSAGGDSFGDPSVLLVPVASAPKDETLYDSLMRYHNENDSTSTDDSGARRRRNPKVKPFLKGAQDAGRLKRSNSGDDESTSVEDQKMPARPVALKQPPLAAPANNTGPKAPPPASSQSKAPPPSMTAVVNRKKPPPSGGSSMVGVPMDEEAGTPTANVPPTSDTQQRPRVLGSFYQAALEASGGSSGMVKPPSPAPAKKPGIVHVREPAIRSNSVLYQAAYGGGQQKQQQQQQQQQQPAPNSKSFPEPLTVVDVHEKLASLKQQRNLQSKRQMINVGTEHERRQPQHQQPPPPQPSYGSSIRSNPTTSLNQPSHKGRDLAQPTWIRSSDTGVVPSTELLRNYSSGGYVSIPSTNSAPPDDMMNIGNEEHMGLRVQNQNKRSAKSPKPYPPIPAAFFGKRPSSYSQRSRTTSCDEASPMNARHSSPRVDGMSTSWYTKDSIRGPMSSSIPGTAYNSTPISASAIINNNNNNSLNSRSTHSTMTPGEYSNRMNARQAGAVGVPGPGGYQKNPIPNQNSAIPNYGYTAPANEMRNNGTQGVSRLPSYPPVEDESIAEQSHSTGASSMDEELRLALEISKQDTGVPNSSTSGYPQRSQASYGSTTRQNAPINRPSPSAANHPNHSFVKQSSFTRDAMAQARESSNSSLADLMLALKLSAEESGLTPGEPDINRRTSTNLDELLAFELAQNSAQSMTDFVAAGISAAPGPSKSRSETSADNPDEQFRILEKIRAEREKRELEMALKASERESKTSSQPGAVAMHHPANYLYSQEKAMEGWARPGFTRNQNQANHNNPTKQRPRTQRENSLSSIDSEGRRRELLERGTSETQEAIRSGQAHVVICRGCGGRLQAPLSYSLVFCPKCQTISPA